MPAPQFGPVGPHDLTISDTPADAGHASTIRRALATWLTGLPFDEYTRGDITLAVYEAVANVVQHAYRHTASAGTVSVRAAYTPAQRALQVVVSDTGRWTVSTPNPHRGYGLPLIDTLADTTTIDRSDTGTTVTMQWALAAVGR